jgi:nickel/cobalt exporter
MWLKNHSIYGTVTKHFVEVIMSRRTLFIFAALLIVLLSIISCGYQETNERGGPRGAFVDLLRDFDQMINERLRLLVNEFSVAALFSLAGISFIYGMLHSAGPGHGKTLIASFFIKEKHPLQKSLILAATVSLVHTGSAVILSLLLTFIFTGIRGMFKIQLQGYFLLASGIMITVVGVVFLLMRIFHRHHHHGLGHDQISQTDSDSNEVLNHAVVSKKGNTGIFMIGVTAGMVPCPVALMIMLLTIARGAVIVGISAVLSISLGMFVLLTGIGMISIISRDGILLLGGRFLKRTELVSVIVEFISISSIILIGSLIIIRFVIR